MTVVPISVLTGCLAAPAAGVIASATGSAGAAALVGGCPVEPTNCGFPPSPHPVKANGMTMTRAAIVAQPRVTLPIPTPFGRILRHIVHHPHQGSVPRR
ncbi:hypothetical protein OG792_05585 [Micromonospora sp. NBC_01699]|uniref:hypothetical protein n=1 Tax=Micromonospora sp. NBC_01699 TaxID=2975984 RepID=UPI002E345841|nr:hypothetical protein [Micromonospora sp. NBC_01699]